MPYISIMLHCVWSTKNREATFLSAAGRRELFAHIRQTAAEKGIFIDVIGGWTDHVHCLLSLGSGQQPDKVIQQLKGESAHWFNARGRGRLEWQNDYFAVSVGRDRLEQVRGYILHQEEHHRHKTFTEEYDAFLREFGFDKKNWTEVHKEGKGNPESPG
jgi:putative transposase